jgi:hypothetical protein
MSSALTSCDPPSSGKDADEERHSAVGIARFSTSGGKSGSGSAMLTTNRILGEVGVSQRPVCFLAAIGKTAPKMVKDRRILRRLR